MLPGLRRDAVTVRRRAGADADGNPIGTVTTVYQGRGTYGSPSQKDLVVADAYGQQVDAVVAIKLPAGTTIVAGDKMTVRGLTWQVLWVTDVVTHNRVGLRKIS